MKAPLEEAILARRYDEAQKAKSSIEAKQCEIDAKRREIEEEKEAKRDELALKEWLEGMVASSRADETKAARAHDFDQAQKILAYITFLEGLSSVEAVAQANAVGHHNAKSGQGQKVRPRPCAVG